MANQQESTVNWARQQIRLRLDEWDKFEELTETGPHDAYYDKLEERIQFAFQEIMKIAFRTQLDFDLEDGASGLDSTETVLEMIHYLTGDPDYIEIIVRD